MGDIDQRPWLLVLAGVNGAGKSSVGGHVALRSGIGTWFNPDTRTRELQQAGMDAGQANAQAWLDGFHLLQDAIRNRRSHAFETTLGGNSIRDAILEATNSHRVLVWFAGLASADLHIARVAARVALGGHDIPATKIRERYDNARLNLIRLLPYIQECAVHDNSRTVAHGEIIPALQQVLHLRDKRVLFPSRKDFVRTPEWAMPIVEAALSLK